MAVWVGSFWRGLIAMPQNYRIKTVTKSEWKDFSSLFESKGAPHYCWCCAWRKVDCQSSKPSNLEKKETIRHQIVGNKPVGILCYHEKTPIGWCSVAPRDSYKPLGGDISLSNVWSIVCFFVRKDYRAKGVMRLLLKSAIKYARAQGAAYVEAYPVDSDSPSYRFMGFKPLFLSEGFSLSGKAGKRRHVMLLKLVRRSL